MSVLGQIGQRLLNVNTLICIDVFYEGDLIRFNRLQIRRHKNELFIDHVEEFDTIQLVLEGFKNEQILLNVRGKGIVSKNVSTVTDDFDALLNQLLPNAKSIDFYIDIFQNSVAVVRQSQVLGLIELIRKDNFLVAFRIGDLAHREIEVLTERKIEIQSDFDFEGEKLNATTALAYFAALLFFTQESTGVQVSLTDLSEARFARLFKKLLPIVLGIPLVLLLANYFLLEYLISENSILQNEVAVYHTYHSESVKLKEKYLAKSHFLASSGWTQSSKTSFYADQLGLIVPKDVLLSKFELMPLNQQELRRNKELIFVSDKIILEGTCAKTTSIDPWVSSIKRFGWVESVEIDDFKFDQKNKLGNFSISIALK